MATKKKKEVIMGGLASGAAQGAADAAVQKASSTTTRTSEKPSAPRSSGTNTNRAKITTPAKAQAQKERTTRRRSTTVDTAAESQHRNGTKGSERRGLGERINDWLLGASRKESSNAEYWEKKAAQAQTVIDQYENKYPSVSRYDYDKARGALEKAQKALADNAPTTGQRMEEIARAAAANTLGSYTGTGAAIAESVGRSTNGSAKDQTRQQYAQAAQRMGLDPTALLLGDTAMNRMTDQQAAAVAAGSAAARQGMYDRAEELTQASAQAQEDAKRGTSTVGGLLVDAGVAGLEMLGDVAVGTATGGNTMLPMLVRSFGGGAAQAAQNGGDLSDQLFEGTKSAAIEWVTEHLFGGNPVYDKGTSLAETAMRRALGDAGFDRLIRSTAARVAKIPTGMVEEGLEEVIGNYLDPLVNRIANSTDGGQRDTALPTARENWQSFGVGALLAATGAGGNVLANQLGEQRAAEGATSAARGTEENHIDNRRSADMGDRRIKAFQFDHPELHGYFAQAAQDLLEDSGYIHLGRGGYSDMSPAMADALDTGLSLTEIQKALQAIVNDNGQENYAAAKRIELLLDGMLENGYSTTTKPNTDTGRGVGPNQAYLDAKAGIAGGSNEWARTLRAEQNVAAIMGEEIDETDVARNFLEENPDLAWQVPEQYRPEYYTARDNGPGFIIDNGMTDAAPKEAFDAEAAMRDLEGRTAAPTTDGRGQEYTGDRPTMPEPTMPMAADGSRAGDERGLDWTNRVSRDMLSPEQARPGQTVRESQSWQTVHDSEVTSEDMASVMETDAFRSMANYIAKTNQGDVDAAIQSIRENGYAKSKDAFIRSVQHGTSGSELVARGALLLKTANDLGRMRDFTEIYIAYKKIGTKAGQTVQAMKIYEKLNNMVDGYAANMTPADQVYLMRKSVAEYNAELPEKKYLTAGQRATQIELDEGLVEQYLNAEREDQREDIRKAILQDLGRQAPSSWVEKLNSWRYFSMLFNPRTHFRNVTSNAVSVPVVLMKDKVAQAMEHFLIPDGAKRTKATLDLRKGSQDRLNMAYASSFYDLYLRDDAGTKWYERGANEIDRNKTIFKKNKVLEGLNNLNSKALDAEDIAFSRPAFAVAFARECKLQGITGADIEAGRADAGTVQGMIDRAQRYSQEMVFRENGKLANWLAKHDSAILSAAVPFKRTPANILTRGWQYSPMGLTQGIVQLNTQVQRGEMSSAEAIDNIAKGVTGTGLMALGVGLAAMGFLTGGGSDDDDQAAFDTLQGRQDFSFRFGDHYISAENFGFEAIPLLVGASLFERLAESGSDSDKKTSTPVLDFLEEAPKVLLGMTEPVFETTMLSSLNNIMNDLQYADGDWFGTIVRSLAGNFINQFFPTLGGAAERTFLEDNRQSTFTDRTGGGSFDVFGKTFDTTDSLLGRWQESQYEMGYRLNRVPGIDYNQIPYIDAWGRETSTGSGLVRAFNNFINPANVTRRQTSEIEAELQRLADTGKDGMFPQRAKQSVKVNDHYLTADEYVAYQRAYGQTALSGVQDAMQSADWKKLSDDEKADRIRSVYKMATEAAKSAVDPDYESSETIFKNSDEIKKAYGWDDAEYTAAYTKYGSSFLTNDMTQAVVKAGADMDDYYTLSEKISKLTPSGGGNVKAWQKLMSVASSDMPEAAKSAYYRRIIDSDNVWAEWQKAKNSGKTMAQWCADHYTSESSHFTMDSKYIAKKNAAARGRRDEDRALYRAMIGG